MVSGSLTNVKTKLNTDLETIMPKYNANNDATAKEIADLALHAMLPIKYLFSLSLGITIACYLTSKYTPMFSSVFKVATLISAIFTFDMHITWSRVNEEYKHFDRLQDTDLVSWDTFRSRVSSCSNGILASTYLISWKKFLQKDLDSGFVKFFDVAKADWGDTTAWGTTDTDGNTVNKIEKAVKEELPGFTKWLGATFTPPTPPTPPTPAPTPTGGGNA